MNDEQCNKCHNIEEPILFRVSCNNYTYEWLCAECIKEIK